MNDEEDVDGLGEELYKRICTQHHQETAGKLTGMLLELPCKVLAQLLQDETMLTEAVEKAMKALQEANEPSKITSNNEDNVSTSSDSMGERLFQLVDLFNTGNSPKITGMLLEQPKEVLVSLISDQTLLEEQVNQAQEALKRQSLITACDSSDVDDAEELGEKLFSLVEQLDQAHANDITGMLLEMDHTALHQLLRDDTLLKVAVQKALSVLAHKKTEKQ